VTANAAAALAVRETNAAAAERSLMDDIRRMEPQYQAAMPRGLEAVQLTRDAFTLLRHTPRLGACNRLSVLGGLMTIAQLGLRAGVLDQAWLVPFWNKNGGPRDERGNPRGEDVAQLIIGYRGYVELAHRSPHVGGFGARTAYANDEFRIRLGTAEEIIHEPLLTGDRGEIIAHYAVAKFTNGGFTFRYKTAAEMRAHRDQFANNPHRASSPWKTSYVAMCDKTMLRDVAKYVPQATALATAVAVDESIRTNLDADTDPTEASRFVDGHVLDEDDADVEATDETGGDE
jgi:recombination protein RecT